MLLYMPTLYKSKQYCKVCKDKKLDRHRVNLGIALELIEGKTVGVVVLQQHRHLKASRLQPHFTSPPLFI